MPLKCDSGGSFLFYCTDLQGVLHWRVGVDGSAASAGRFNPGQASRGIIQAASSSIQMVGSWPSVGVEGASRLLGVGGIQEAHRAGAGVAGGAGALCSAPGNPGATVRTRSTEARGAARDARGGVAGIERVCEEGRRGCGARNPRLTDSVH